MKTEILNGNTHTCTQYAHLHALLRTHATHTHAHKHKHAYTHSHQHAHARTYSRRIVTPARYIFIQAVDTEGRNFTMSAGSDIFQARIILEQNGRRSALKTQLRYVGVSLQCFECSYLVLSRLWLATYTPEVNAHV